MPIYRLLKDSEFGPEEIKVIAAAYERVCEHLELKAKPEHIRQLVAKRVLALAQTGERDPQWISKRVVRDLLGRPPKPK